MGNPEQLTTLEKKIERFSDILERMPGDGLTVLALAEATFRRGLRLEALTNYQVVTSLQPVPEAHLAVAEIYFQQGMISEAYGELGRLFEIDRENVEARLLALSLKTQGQPPQDIATILEEPVSDEAFVEARLRLQIQKTIHNRELQERTRNGTLEPGIVIHEYHVEEAVKKLLEVQDLLRKLEELREQNSNRLVAPRPETLVAPVQEFSTFSPDDATTPSMYDYADQQQLPEEEVSTISVEDNPEELVEMANQAFPEQADGPQIDSYEPEVHTFDPPSLEDFPVGGVEPAPSSFDVESVEEAMVSELSSIEVHQDTTSLPVPIAFEIAPEDLISPDLPEEDAFQEAPPPMIMFEDSGPELGTYSAVPALEIVEDEPILMIGLEEPISEYSAIPEEDSSLAEVEATTVVEAPIAKPSVEDRQAFYESKAEDLGKLTGTLARTRGVTSIFLASRDGFVIDSVVKDDISEGRIGELVRESFEFLMAYSKLPSYWVLECTGGIFVMQTIDEGHVLIVVGQAGANFGALRYTMDKTKTSFAGILADLPR